MIEIEEIERECSLPKQNKLFICTQNPSKSFIMPIEKSDYNILTLERLYDKANILFNSKNSHFEISKQSFKSFYAKQPDLDQRLAKTQFNLLPIYFQEKQISFELDIQYRDDIIHLVLPSDISQKELLIKLSKQINVPIKNLYLVKDNQAITEKLIKFQKIELYSTDNIIYIDDKQYQIAMDLPLNENRILFGFRQFNQIFKERVSINMEKSLKELGFANGEKFVSFSLIDIFINETQIQITSNYSPSQIRNLFNDLYPNEIGFIAQSLNNQAKKFYKVKSSQIYIKSLTGEIFTIDCECSDTIENLQLKIQDKKGIHRDQQRLIYDNKQLDDKKTLNECGLFQEDTLLLLLRLRGGATAQTFVDLENEISKKKMQFSNDAPIYRLACQGINIEGYCKNKKCPYYDRLVISQIGYKTIELIQNIYEKIQCPNYSCKCYIELVTCGFTNCQYKWSGIKVEKGKDKHIHSPMLSAQPDSYTRYNPVKDDGTLNTALWKQLFLFAKPLESDEQFKCSVCLKSIAEENEISTFELCQDKEKHKCHKNCYEKISILLKMCPLCITIT
ncbi:ubiquitin (macronuclear) [Tetrahymena thermophila SB210]|uniref:Ubiquitin n=1 Tax=Tetrahymena thermophila (strain SB210) TaxID=312017 RepID=A4VDK0_TETTS|nr:ubiquitin [Tetrahymena thermophila SB210]EDK31603.2 ubiquitin [Tetrahymena thermophila SB210]|eukprot:XP_001470863.2 ubiquitin [Tetrahymena thermophila SB210]